MHVHIWSPDGGGVQQWGCATAAVEHGVLHMTGAVLSPGNPNDPAADSYFWPDPGTTIVITRKDAPA